MGDTIEMAHMTAARAILTLNAGSSSIKCALFRAGDGEDLHRLLGGEVEDLAAAPVLHLHAADGTKIAETRWPADGPLSFATILDALIAQAEAHLGSSELVAVGHRVVHGGTAYATPTIVTSDLLTSLQALTPLDPLHLPRNLMPIHAIAAARPDLVQVVCFDTAFHHTMPLEARQIALPSAVTAAGVRRFGFHGLSYEYISGELRRIAPDLARGRVIVAHLGSGASLCALRNGASIATTMGFSTLDGLVMSTRCGQLDPGVIFYLARMGHDLDDIESMLYRRSGLLGVSGLSGDIRELLASHEAGAEEALTLFTYRIACEIGGLVSALGGLDCLVFTAGIGEHAPAIRKGICDRLTWCGLELDPVLNTQNASSISTMASRVHVRVMATDEERMIARHTHSLLV